MVLGYADPCCALGKLDPLLLSGEGLEEFFSLGCGELEPSGGELEGGVF